MLQVLIRVIFVYRISKGRARFHGETPLRHFVTLPSYVAFMSDLCAMDCASVTGQLLTDRTCVCMHRCMHVCVYVCIYVCMCVCVCMCVYVCMYVCMYVRTYVRMYVCMYVVQPHGHYRRVGGVGSRVYYTDIHTYPWCVPLCLSTRRPMTRERLRRGKGDA